MSRVHVHRLDGCAPTPLAHYLKALAVLRLVAEQADPAARGFWRAERFHLVTTLDRAALDAFFLQQYAPTPLVAPWNGGSGFYPKDNKEGIDAIAGSVAPRLAEYREAIAAARGLTEALPASPKKDAKEALLQRCRETWRGPLAAWLEAALVIGADGSPSYPALLGTGGNDGRLDFTNNFMRQLARLLDMLSEGAPPREEAAPLLRAALWGDPTPGLVGGAIGQFLPGGAGGANQSAGFGADSQFNPWDFVLMLEGTIVFRASLVRRADSEELPQAAAPFALRSAAIGYGSAAAADEGARGEQWMPLWSAPTTYAELAQLFAEGRSKLRERTAQRPLEFARAIARLGVARGIVAFERFGYIERNGQANLAVPLGRWVVAAQAHQNLIDEVAPWVDRLRGATRADHAPASLRAAARSCEEAMLACCRQSAAPYWQALLLRLADAEQALLRSPRFTHDRDLRPLPRLSPGWVTAAAGSLAEHDPEALELRLALAIASLHGLADAEGSAAPRPDWSDPIRRHWLPIDLASRASYRRPRFRAGADAIDRPPEVVGRGENLLRDATQVLRRRALTRARGGTLGLVPAVWWTAASLRDIAALIHHRIDERRCLSLALALMALDWRTLADGPELLARTSDARAESVPSALFGVLRLAVPLAPVPSMRRLEYDPGSGRRAERLAPGFSPAVDPAVLERLLAEDLQGALRVALSRLRAAGLRPRISVAASPVEELRAVAASLLVPLRARYLHDLADALTKPASEAEAKEPPPLDDSEPMSTPGTIAPTS